MSSVNPPYNEISVHPIGCAPDWMALGFTSDHTPEEIAEFPELATDPEYLTGKCPVPGCTGRITVSAADNLLMERCSAGCTPQATALAFGPLPTTPPTDTRDLRALNGWWMRAGATATPPAIDPSLADFVRVLRQGYRDEPGMLAGLVRNEYFEREWSSPRDGGPVRDEDLVREAWHGPYRPELEPLDDDIALGNCPCCWPIVSQIRVDRHTGAVSACTHGCSSAHIVECLLSAGEDDRLAIIERYADQERERRTEVIDRRDDALATLGGLDLEDPMAPLDIADRKSRRGGVFSTIDDVLSLPPIEYLIGGLLPEASTAMVWGKPNSFKSFFTIDLAMHVATGRSWHGREVKQGRVVYAALEGVRGIGKRLRAWGQEHGVELDGFDDLVFVEDLHLTDGDDVRTLVRGVADFEPRLVVIDTLSRAIPGVDENAAKEMSVVMDVMERLRRLGCTVVMLHHANKGGDYRGSTAILGAIDVSVEVQRANLGWTFEAKVHKQKDDEEGAPILLSVEKVNISDTESSLVVVDPSQPIVPAMTLAQRIIEYVRANPNCSQRTIVNNVSGNKQEKVGVLLSLTNPQSPTVAPTLLMSNGPRGAILYRLADD